MLHVKFNLYKNTSHVVLLMVKTSKLYQRDGKSFLDSWAYPEQLPNRCNQTELRKAVLARNKHLELTLQIVHFHFQMWAIWYIDINTNIMNILLCDFEFLSTLKQSRALSEIQLYYTNNVNTIRYRN